MNKNRYIDKIARIRKESYRKGDFIIADTKDAAVTGGVKWPPAGGVTATDGCPAVGRGWNSSIRRAPW